MNRGQSQQRISPGESVEAAAFSSDWVPVSRRIPWFVVLGGGLLLAAQIGFMALVLVTVRHRDHSMQIEQFRINAEMAALTHARGLTAWTAPFHETARQLADDSDIKAFARGVAAKVRLVELRAHLVTVLPDMQRSLDHLVGRTALDGAYFFGPNGGSLVTSGMPASPTITDWANRLLKQPPSDIVPRLMLAGEIPVLAIAVPYANPDGDQPGNPAVAGLLIIQRLVPETLLELRDRPGTGRLSIIQRGATGNEQLLTGADGQLTLAAEDVEGHPPLRTGFYLDPTGTEYFATIKILAGTPWFIHLAMPVAVEPVTLLLTQVNEFTGVLLGLILADILLLLLIVRAFRQQGEDYDREGTVMARRMQARQELFQAIARTVTGLVGVKDMRGRYTYVNRTMAEMLGRQREDMTGLTDNKLFSPDTARVLMLLDEDARNTAQPVTQMEDLNIGGQRLHLRLSTLALRDNDKQVVGTVLVAQDMTRTVNLARQRERHLEEVVLALTDTIGLADPHLAGHSARVRDLAVATARLLAVDDEDIEVLGLAATLSQAGKLAIPQDILTKGDRLTPEEQEIMKGHVANTLKIIEGIEFPGPVDQVLAHMHERLDGGGYPSGLKGNEISILGRILGTVDVFVARTSPRSYREAISAKQAIAILEDHPERYDPMVVSAIRTASGL